MKKIPINFVILIIWLFYPCISIFAQPVSCSSNANCQNDQICSLFDTNGVCVAKCPETACSEDKPVCDLRLGGICTKACNQDYTCPTGLVCEEISGMCIPSEQSCTNNEDCATGFVCDKIIPNAQHIYENKSFGSCTPKCTDENSCKYTNTTPFRSFDKHICDTNNGGLCIPNCNDDNYACPIDSYCNSKTGMCVQSKVCTNNTECDNNMVCNLLSKDTNNQGIVTRGGVCEPRCPDDMDCPTNRPICDLRLGGLCTVDCTQNGYKCPLYNDGTTSLQCNTEAGDNKGLCSPVEKSCKVDTDCAENELCDHIKIDKDHKFTTTPVGVCTLKCDENVSCSFTNNTPFRSPEKPKCNYEPGGLCEPDCSLNVYTCPNCRQCDKESGLCYGFTDDFIIVLVVKGVKITKELFSAQENIIRSRIIAATPNKKIIITSSNISDYSTDVTAHDSNENDINIFIVKQENADAVELKKVEDAANTLTTTVLPNSGKIILNKTIEL
jgi:hypothetical protein